MTRIPKKKRPKKSEKQLLAEHQRFAIFLALALIVIFYFLVLDREKSYSGHVTATVTRIYFTESGKRLRSSRVCEIALAGGGRTSFYCDSDTSVGDSLNLCVLENRLSKRQSFSRSC